MMMPLVKADGKAEFALLDQLTSRSGEVDRKVTAAVSAILDAVRTRGDDALRDYTRQFDGVDPGSRTDRPGAAGRDGFRL